MSSHNTVKKLDVHHQTVSDVYVLHELILRDPIFICDSIASYQNSAISNAVHHEQWKADLQIKKKYTLYNLW